MPGPFPRRFARPLLALLTALLLAPGITPAAAQTAFTETDGGFVPDALRNPKIEMRRIIRDMATYARKLKPSFVVIVEDGLRLIADEAELDRRVLVPNASFMEDIDGLIVDGLRHPADGPREKEEQDRIEELATIARNARLPLLTIEHVPAAEAGAAIARDLADGYIPFVPENPLMGSVPAQPARPAGENGNSIGAARDVKNFIVVRDSAAFGPTDEFERQIRATNYDLLIMDIYHGGKPVPRSTVRNLEYKLLGARRLVLATVDVSRTDPFRFYWKEGWKKGSPSFLDEKVEKGSPRHYVRYWRDPWRDILFGNAQSYVYGLLAHGFDGMVIRGADAFRFFDGSLEEEKEERAARAILREKLKEMEAEKAKREADEARDAAQDPSQIALPPAKKP